MNSASSQRIYGSSYIGDGAPLVYLCGPIGGQTVQVALDWRLEAARLLAPEFRTLSPLRDADYRSADLDPNRVIAARETASSFTDNEIVERDLLDIRRSYLVLRHYSGPSEGSPMECAYAKMFGVPVVVSGVTDSRSVSPWLRYHAVRLMPSLTEAVQYIKSYWALP
jgi:hypothetical protein